MERRIKAHEVGERRVRAADLASKRKPPPGTSDVERADALLRLRSARVVALPEPVTVPGLVNGRRLEPWEAGLYVEWAHRKRRAELVLFAGLIG